MSTTALDDRTFENVVDQTPEELAATRKHFVDKGYVIEDVPDPDDEAQPPPADATNPPAPGTPAEVPADPPVAQPIPVEQAQPAEDDLMDEALGIGGQPEHDSGDKKGRSAKRNQKARELREENERLKRELATARQTAPQPAQGMPAATPPPAPVAAPAPPSVEPSKPVEFSKPRPATPKYEDFLSADDPQVAFNAAVAEHADKIADWKFEKRDHDDSERQRVAQETSRVASQQTERAQQVNVINSRIQAAKAKYADYETVVNAANVPGGASYSPMLKYLMTEHLPDGFELAYELGKPENRALLQSITERTQFRDNDQASMRQAEIVALTELGEFRARLTAPPLPAVTPQAPPASAVPVQTPPAAPPRRVEAAPVPVRGGGGPTRIEPHEMNPDDSDARRAARRQLGQMANR